MCIKNYLEKLFKKEVKMINLNDFAKEVTEEEGLKDSLSIAQVKEVMRIVFKKLAKMSVWEISDILRRYKK